MSDDRPDPDARLQEWNDEFDALVYRPTQTNEGMVLNTAQEPPTMYAVDLEERTCECQWMTQREDNGEVCKHLAKGMLAHPDFTEAPDLLTRDMSVLVDRANEAVRRLEEADDGFPAAEAMGGAADDSEAATDDEASGIDPLAALDAQLERLGVFEDQYNAWIDDQYGSLQFETEYIDDSDVYGDFMDWVQGTDAINWDQENERNYIKRDDIEEVLG